MSFDSEASLVVVKDALEAMSPQRFAAVRIGLPRENAVLPTGFTAVVSMQSARVVELTLQTAIELHTMRIGIWRAKAAGPAQDEALMLYRVPPEVMDVLKGNFSLDGNVRAIDEGGMYGQAPEVEYDEEEIADKPYWTAHITLPLIVDPSAVFVA